MFGISTSAIAFAGNDGSNKLNNVESWNGSSWTEVAEFNTAAVEQINGAGTTNTSGIKFGGEAAPGKLANTEDWDGTTWTEVADLPIPMGQNMEPGIAT